MTANDILDQSDRVQQSLSLSEFAFRAWLFDKQTQALEKKNAAQIIDLFHELDKEHKQSRKVVSFYRRLTITGGIW